METKDIKKERLDVMMDMETADLAETAAILEIALVPFCMDGTDAGEEEIHAYVDLTSCFLEGMTISRKTQEAWEQWDTPAKLDLIHSEKKPIRKVIREAYDYLKYLNEKYDLHVWCRGKNFDIPKFEYCVRTLLGETEMPYHFWKTEDARDYPHTFNVHSSDIEFEGNPHCALDDCYHQIKQVQAAFLRYRKLKHHAFRSISDSLDNNPQETREAIVKLFGINLTDEELKVLLN